MDRLEAQNPVNILLVDDREDNLLALNAVLRSHEYRLVNATSGTQALACLADQDFAVILLDVQMPGMDGLETARRVRSNERSANTPIILVTGMFPDEAHIRLGYEVGAVDFVSKPFDPRIMKCKVAVFAELYRKTEKIRAQEKLLHEASESRFRTLFEESPLGLQLYSPEGDCVGTNRAWEALWGEEASSLRAINVLREPDRLPAGYAIREALWGTPTALPAIRYGSKWIESFAYPVRNEQGRVREAAVIVVDVTGQKSAEDELRRSRDQLEKAVQARDEFISIASHELKTPVTSLILHAEMAALLLNRQSSEKAPGDEARERIRKYVEVSSSQIDRLSRLIEEMLDVSRIGNGKLSMEKERVDLARLVRKVMDDFSEQLRETGARAELESEGPVEVFCDRYRIEQVVTNLLTNAMKYGERRPIRVALRKRGSLAELSMRDQGIGISPEHHQRIFERFERAVSASAVSGLGLGLYIVKKIVEAHDGRVGVESVPGQGSTFTVTLPTADTFA